MTITNARTTPATPTPGAFLSRKTATTRIRVQKIHAGRRSAARTRPTATLNTVVRTIQATTAASPARMFAAPPTRPTPIIAVHRNVRPAAGRGAVRPSRRVVMAYAGPKAPAANSTPVLARKRLLFVAPSKAGRIRGMVPPARLLISVGRAATIARFWLRRFTNVIIGRTIRQVRHVRLSNASRMC